MLETPPAWDVRGPRLPGWERGYADVLNDHFSGPFGWGVSDCLTIVGDLSLVMCGRDVLPIGLRRYRTAFGAARVLRQLGFGDVASALTHVFPEIPLARARRGDCGVLRQMRDGLEELTTMIVLGDGSAVGKGPEGGMVRVRLDRLEATFAIGDF